MLIGTVSSWNIEYAREDLLNMRSHLAIPSRWTEHDAAHQSYLSVHLSELRVCDGYLLTFKIAKSREVVLLTLSLARCPLLR